MNEQSEREAIVAWLQDKAARTADFNDHWNIHLLADAIERGEPWKGKDDDR